MKFSHRHGLARRHAAREARGDRRGRLRGRRDLRDRHPRPRRPAAPRSAAWCATSASRSSPSSRSATSRACPSRSRARGFERARRKFELMNELGAGRDPRLLQRLAAHALGGIDRAADDLRELGEIAAGFGIEIGFEALAWGRHVSRLARRLGDRAPRRPSAGRLILDSCHILARGLPGRRRSARSRPTASPSSSSPTRRGSTWTCCSWSRHFRNFPGPGRPAGRRLHGGGRSPPATTAGSATRSSTTASAWPRRVASPRTASAR